MSDKSFKVKSGLQIPGVTSANILTTDSSGNVSSSSTLAIANGGTGQTTATNAINALLPLQTSNDNYFLQTSGVSPQWSKVFYQAIKDNGTTVTPRGYLNIVGGTFSDDSTNDITTLTIPTNYVSTSGGSTITPSTTSTIGLTLASPAGQTGHLLYAAGGTRIPAGGNYLITPGLTVTYTSDFNAGLASVVPITVKGAASQTANLTEWRNSAGTLLSRVDNNGGVQSNYLYAGTYSFYNSQLNVTSIAASNIGAVIRGAASQTADLQQWQDSAANVMVKVNNLGLITANGVSSSGATNATTNTGALFTTNSASRTPIGVRGAASQTADLQYWQNSGAVALAAVTSSGRIWASSMTVATSGAVTAGSQFGVVISSASTVGVGIKAAASQTANLQEWQNSTGAVVASINAFGTFTGLSSSNGFTSDNVSNVVFYVKGKASQTANLQEWRNSAGTVLASLSASGNLMVQDLTVNGTTTTINSTTLTVDDKNIELASVSSPTDTTADGAGITIKGATDKTFNWVQSTAAFTSSEPISAPAFKSAGTAVSSNITLVSGYRYFVDTTSARTLTLPASPSLGDEIQIYDASNNALTNNITVASNSNKIQGSVQDLIIDSNAATVYLTYTGSTYGWAVN